MASATEEKRDVLTRLDSLLARGQEVESGPNSVTSSTSTCSSTPSSILKTSKGNSVKKKISFPEDKLQEVIGYGGEDAFSSEDEDEEIVSVSTASKKFEAKENNDSSANEMTTEEKNMLNVTRQNTSFNSRPHNLNPEAPRLGVDKKVTPLITVRPFGHRNDTNTSTPINKVSPMKNGELVEAKNNMAITLNSDGASTESSSSEEEISRPTSGLERQFLKAKQSAATARLSFLNSTITEANKGEATTDIVSNWVKSPEEVLDEVDEARIKKKNVKLTRKSPYVVGPYASTAILKGTPKPSISVRKPPIPAKPEKLLASSSISSASSTTSSTSSSGCESPIAAPRRNYSAADYEVTISDESRIELSSTASSETSDHEVTTSFGAECYSVDADVKNEVIYDVSAISNDIVSTVQMHEVTVNQSVEVGEVKKLSLVKEEEEEDQLDLSKQDICSTTTTAEDVKSIIAPSAAVVTSLPKVQQNLASKNQLALEAIRKSLANKFQVQEELSKKEQNDPEDVQQIIVKASSSTTTSSPSRSSSVVSSNFEANRASIANALFSNNNNNKQPDKFREIARPASTKKQAAPMPPNTEISVAEDSKINNNNNKKNFVKLPEKSEVDDHHEENNKFEVATTTASEAKDDLQKPPPTTESVTQPQNLTKDPTGQVTTTEVNSPKQDSATSSVISEAASTTPSSTTTEAIKPTIKSALSMKSDSSPKVKTVQFSPETMTMTLPNSEPDLISYNRWISRDPHGSPAIVESSFTGQPIAVQPPRQQVTHLNKKPVLQQGPPTEDEIRKWTEKKRRSKSLPRGGSEIDEILGSSKTKPPSRLFPIMSPQPIPATVAPPVHRQSRVELYENERKKLRQSTKFQSIKKLFKLGSNPNLTSVASATSETASNLSVRRNSISSSNNSNELSATKFMDKDHEREILERDRSRLKPEILHPLDLQSGGVEVVTITPKSQTHALYEKNQKAPVVKSKSIMKKLEESSKDSGHETSSIHTENSENESSDSSATSGGQTHRDGIQHAGLGKNKLYSVGLHRAKPVPPPRSHSLEASASSSSHQPVKKEGERGNACHLSENLAKNDEILMGETPVPTPPPAPPALPSTPPSSAAALADDEHISNNNKDDHVDEEDEATNHESLPPNGYVVAGKMNLGATISVPPPNSAHLRRDVFKKLMPTTPFHHHHHHGRSESLSSGSSCLHTPHLQTLETESISERESISPLRLEPNDEEESVKSSNSRSKLGSRLSVRNGRSVVHKNLEDNYGAVISANHEALAQILEQTSHHHRPAADLTKALKMLNNSETTLKWSDFLLIDEAGFMSTKAGTFYSATYSATKTPVTLLVSPAPVSPTDILPDTSSPSSSSHKTDAFSLSPVSKFISEDASAEFMSSTPADKGRTISVFGRLQVETLESYTKKLANSVKMASQAWEKEISFVLLQLVNGLKSLQAQGIEEIEACLDQFLLIRADKDPHYRLMILNPVSNGPMSLCASALAAMLLFFQSKQTADSAVETAIKSAASGSIKAPVVLPEITPSVGMFRTMAELLQVESSMALGQVKSMLEYMLWGPSDIAFEVSNQNQESREQALQRWLDLERATVLHNLIRTQGLWRIHLTVFEEYHLLFLVQTCAKMLHEASLLFESEVACM